jgi:quercetin dioxygenase-like cupin family protein
VKDFPEFMKSKSNHISSKEQNTEDIDGYFYEGVDGSQMAFWTCYSDRVSKKHTHEFDEYMVCINGQYTAVLNDEEFVLNPGDELFIPKGQNNGENALREQELSMHLVVNVFIGLTNKEL